MATNSERMALLLLLKNKEFDFLIVGSLCNNDLLLASQLLKMGFKVKIVRYKNEMESIDSILLEELKLDKSIIILFSSKYSFLKSCFRSKVIFSFSGSLIFFLGKYILLLKTFFFPPVIHYTTGSDLMESPFQKNLIGWLYRFLLKNCYLICLVPMKNYFDAVKKLKLDNFVFVRHPFLLNLEKKKGNSQQKSGAKIVFLHVSNIDCGITDNGINRKSTKGSDKFIKSFIKLSAIYQNIKCIILERGPDVSLAKKMIEESGCGAFEWIKPTSSQELYRIFDLGDVVVDQFDLGCFGGVAVEAMSYGKPLLTYASDFYIKGMFYNDAPLIFNAKTEDEIQSKIEEIALMSKKDLYHRGIKSKEWVRKHYNNEINFIDILMKLDIKFNFDFIKKVFK